MYRTIIQHTNSTNKSFGNRNSDIEFMIILLFLGAIGVLLSCFCVYRYYHDRILQN